MINRAIRMLRRGFTCACIAGLTLFAFLARPDRCHAAAPENAPPEIGHRYGETSSVMDWLYRDRIQAELQNVLSVTLFEAAFDPAAAKDAHAYSIVSGDDPAYAEGSHIAPASVGVSRRVTRLSDRVDLMKKPTTLFLILPKPMTRGRHYCIVADALSREIAKLPAVCFDDRSEVNDNLRVNQLGYLPRHTKYAYVGQFLGDAGPMRVTAGPFQLIDERGESRFQGKLVERSAGPETVGQQVMEADFSSFNEPGTYQVQVDGIGVSCPFVIAADAYNPSLGNLMRGNFHERCGFEIPEAWSRFGRPACHLDDALLDASAAKLKFVDPKNPPLYEADMSVRERHCTHGHHDAGDYGKYTISGAGYVFTLLHAYETFPDRFGEDNLGLPSSGNHIPDLLDEAKWELDWLETMQDTDGGVFGVIRPSNGGYEDYLPPAKNGRLLFPKDTVFTGAYAGALAKAARSPMIQKYFPDDAHRYLEKARRAWAWLQKNDRYTQYFHYGAEFGDRDERCWAAAELYLATGEAPFANYLKEHFDPALKRYGWVPLFESQGHAVMSLAAAAPNPQINKLSSECKSQLKSACDGLVVWSQANPYRLSFPPEAARFKKYGWIFPGELAGFPLLLGFAAFNDARYLDCALSNMSYSMGCNASGHFLFSGLGQKRNIEIVHNPSKYDGILEPSPGIPLGIGSDSIYFLHRYGARVGEGQYPAEWPLLNRWYDGFNVQTEFTTPQLAKETVVAAFFAHLPAEPLKLPIPAISAASKRTTEGYVVSFSAIDADNKGVRQVFWDFDDESFSTAVRPTHVFADPGRHYRVAVTLVDASGQWRWAQKLIVAPVADPAYRVAPLPADAGVLLRFSLNYSLRSDKGEATLSNEDGGMHRRPYRFDPSAASWMSKPAGAALVLFGNERFAGALPDNARAALFDKGLFIDAMIYVDEFNTRGFPGNPVLLGLTQAWDAWAGLQQDTWDQGATPAFKSVKEVGSTPEVIARLLPTHRWFQVRIEFSPARGCRLLIDGKEAGSGPSFPFRAGEKAPIRLSVGPWHGMIDDLTVGRLN